MTDTIIYFYLIKQIDFIPFTKDYEKLYNDVISYVPLLDEELQKFVINYIRKNIKHYYMSKWLRKLKTFCKQTKFK